jgi:hypothetical protein
MLWEDHAYACITINTPIVNQQAACFEFAAHVVVHARTLLGQHSSPPGMLIT